MRLNDYEMSILNNTLKKLDTEYGIKNMDITIMLENLMLYVKNKENLLNDIENSVWYYLEQVEYQGENYDIKIIDRLIDKVLRIHHNNLDLNYKDKSIIFYKLYAKRQELNKSIGLNISITDNKGNKVIDNYDIAIANGLKQEFLESIDRVVNDIINKDKRK